MRIMPLVGVAVLLWAIASDESIAQREDADSNAQTQRSVSIVWSARARTTERQWKVQHLLNVGDINGDGWDDLAIANEVVVAVAEPERGRVGVQTVNGRTGQAIESVSIDCADKAYPNDGSVKGLIGGARRDAAGEGAGILIVVEGEGDSADWLGLAVDGVAHRLIAFESDCAWLWPWSGVVHIGDCNYDQVPDLAVRCRGPGWGSHGSLRQGASEGFLRILSGLDYEPMWEIRPAGRFGDGLVSVGDVDGDGRGDIAITYSKIVARGAVPEYGVSIRVLSGADGRLIRSITVDSVGDDSESRLESAGDLDGDGVHELLLGLPFESESGIQKGRVLVLSAVTGRTLFDLWGSASGRAFGRSLIRVWDVDDDGVTDFAIGSPGVGGSWDGWRSLDTSAGYVVIVSGRTGGTIYTLRGTSRSERFGASLASVEGRGHGDEGYVVVGAEGTPSQGEQGALYGFALE